MMLLFSLNMLFFTYFQTVIGLECEISQNAQRIDCHPEPGSNEDSCLRRRCCWRPLNEKKTINSYLDVPYCHFPKDYPQYKVVSGGFVQNGYICSIEKDNDTFIPNEILKLNVIITFVNKKTLRVRITDPNANRYEVPVFLNNKNTNTLNNDKDFDYQIDVKENPFSLKVFRKSTGRLL